MRNAVKIAAIYWLLSQAIGLVLLALFVAIFLLGR
jgi:hypothetical protein